MLVANVPFVLKSFINLLLPFFDPVTRSKLKFDVQVVEDGHFTADQLLQNDGWGGSRDFQWDFHRYWPHLLGMCEELNKRRVGEWKALGGHVGASEWDIKVGTGAQGSTGSI